MRWERFNKMNCMNEFNKLIDQSTTEILIEFGIKVQQQFAAGALRND